MINYTTLFYEIYDKNVKNFCTNDMNINVKKSIANNEILRA